MVTSYYIMKMAKIKDVVDTEDYFTSLLNAPKSKGIYFSRDSKCRVCFKRGKIPIFRQENSSEIIESLQILGNIEINKDDSRSGYLCDVCLKFIKSAISFRKIAKRTNEIIKQQLNPTNSENDEDNNALDRDSEKCFDDKLEEELRLEKKLIQSKNRSKMFVPCEVCNKLVRLSYYKTHITIHDPDPEKYVCDICGKSFRLGSGYYNHRLRHRTDYPFKCKLCPFKGKSKDGLKSHMRTHTGEYRYMCTECPERFVFRSNFNRHVLKKHREPQFKCDGCEKLFHTKIEVQRHNDVEHLGLREHVCNTCGKTFGYKKGLNKHQRKVHKREILKFHTKSNSSNITNSSVE